MPGCLRSRGGGEGWVGQSERVGRGEAHIAHWRLRRNHRQDKQKQWYADKMLHLDGNRFVDSKVNEKKP